MLSLPKTIPREDPGSIGLMLTKKAAFHLYFFTANLTFLIKIFECLSSSKHKKNLESKKFIVRHNKLEIKHRKKPDFRPQTYPAINGNAVHEKNNMEDKICASMKKTGPRFGLPRIKFKMPYFICSL
jgi:hypothetical protein